MRKIHYIIIFFCAAILAVTTVAVYFGYFLADTKKQIRELTEKNQELQRTNLKSKATAKKIAIANRDIITATKRIKQRIDNQYAESREASKVVTQELQEIITHSKALEYVRMDSSGLECYSVIRSTHMDSSEIEEKN